MGVHDEYVNIIKTAERFNRSRTSIARRCPHNRDTLIAARQSSLEQLADQLHSKVFERQRWAMEQLKQIVTMIQLDQRRTRGVTKAFVGSFYDTFEIVVRECIAHEWPHDLKRDFFIGLTSHRLDVISAELWNGFWHV